MELARIPLAPGFVFGLLLAAAVAVNLPPRKPGLRRPALALSEIPIVLLILLLLAESVWKCIFAPGLTRDAIVGMDLVAKIAVEEKTIASSVFTGPELAGKLSNQPFYAPFVMLMQLLFRLAGEPLGKVWPAALFVSFVVFIHGWLRERLHPLLAGFFVLCFVATPIVHSYSYFVVTDLANAIFFGMAVLFLHRYLESRSAPESGFRDLATAAVFMTAVTWSRSEAVFLIPYGAFLLLWGRLPWRRRLRDAALFAVPPAAAFLLWHGLYFSLYLGTRPTNQFIPGLMNPGEFLDLSRQFLGLLGDPSLYGSMFYLFLLVLAADLVRTRRLPRPALLGWFPFLFLLFLLVVHHFPAASVDLTVKRGFMKLFPLILVVLGTSPALAALSKRLSAWETGK